MRSNALPARHLRRATLLLTALVVAALAVLTAVVAVPASAVPAPLTGSASGRCLDVAGASTAAGAAVNIYACHGRSNQSWDLTPAGELRVYDGSMCLDVSGASTAPGARVIIWTCTGGGNQRWTVNPDGTVVGVQSRLCLDVANGATADSSPVRMSTCNGAPSQRWLHSGGPAVDRTPPSDPANARVSDLTCESVTFAWDAAGDDVAVAFYDVYHDGQLMRSVSGTTLSTVLAVVPGAVWGLYVNARDAAGNVSQASATVAISPPQCQVDRTPPTAPTRLTGTASGTTVTLTWAAASDDTGVRSYAVLRDGVQAGAVTGTGANAPATTFTDSGLTADTTYRYAVVARDAQGNASPPSTAVQVRTAGACANAVCAVREVARDTDIPWGLATLPDGTVLYTRRDAHDLVLLDPETGAKTTVGTVPGVQSTDGEGGLMGLAISPTFASDRYVYLMHTSPTDNRIVRIRLTDGRLDPGSRQVLLSGLLRNKYHDGGRLRFGPDGKLYASTGDAQYAANAQNIDNLSGKVLRLNPDGSVPADNPFGNHVWSYGHRNPQGLAFDSQGRLWEQEFGNSVMDETNLIERGGNYGWPDCEGTVSQGGSGCGTAGYIAPKRTYPTAEASCSGITVVRDALYVACARGARLYRAQISGSNLTSVQQYFVGTYGRLRTVEPAPDGGLWLTTTTTGDKDSTPNNSNERIFHVTLGR